MVAGLTFQSATSSRSLLPIDLRDVMWRTVRLPDTITEIQGFAQSIGGKPVVERTGANGRFTGDKNKNLKRIDVRFSFKGGFATVRETSATVSGSVAWERIREALVRLVPELKSLEFTVTNTAIKFNLKKSLRLEHIEREIRRKKLASGVEFEPERFPGLRLKFSDGIVANVFENGTITAQGRNLDGFERRFRDLLEKRVDSPYKIGAREMSASPVAARKNLAKKRAKTIANRYSPARNWTNTRPGFYVRPGPNKVARFYAVPKNPALVRQKVLKAYADIGVNVPNATRIILGIPRSAEVRRRPAAATAVTNWNAGPPAGMYVRPGPGGLPRLYKIPKLIKQGKKTVVEAYKKAGVRIPNRVRAVFGIPSSVRATSTSPSPTTSKIPKLDITNRGIFRIDGLDCSRYKLEDLKRIAQRMGVPTGGRRTKVALCGDIKKILTGKAPEVAVASSPNFVKNGMGHYILVNERRIRRNGREKALNSFKVQNLKNMILAFNNSENVTGLSKKKNLINKLVGLKKNMLNLGNELNFMLKSASSSSSGGSPPPGRSGLNIARNILGPNFTNSELRNFLNRYKKSPASLNRLVNEFKSGKKKKLIRLAKANVESL